MTGLFDQLSRRFSAPPAILPRPRLRYEDTAQDAGFRDEILEAAPEAASLRPDAMPAGMAASAPAHVAMPPRPWAAPVTPRIAAEALPRPADPARDPAPDPAPVSPASSGPPQNAAGQFPPSSPPPAPRAAPQHPASPATKAPEPPAVAPSPGRRGAEMPPPSRAAAAGWQRSAIPPLSPSRPGAAPHPVTSVAEIARAASLPPESELRAPDEPRRQAVPLPEPSAHVEIHIGRIEVAAPRPAPQLAPRPAPQPAPQPAPAASARPAAGPRAGAPARPPLSDYLGWKR